jgi:hypothetical protein
LRVRVGREGAITPLAGGKPYDLPAAVAVSGAHLHGTLFAPEAASAGTPAGPGIFEVTP